MGRYARNSIGQYAPVGAAADDLPGGATPTGKKTIDTTAEVDVASYATAQVVDENLTAANIKKDVEVLGILGEFEGGGGGGGGGFLDLPTATITTTYTFPEGAQDMTPVKSLTGWTCYIDSQGNAHINGDSIPDSVDAIHIPYGPGRATELVEVHLTANDSEQMGNEFRIDWNASTCSGGVEYSEEYYCALVTGDGHIDVVLQWMD